MLGTLSSDFAFSKILVMLRMLRSCHYLNVGRGIIEFIFVYMVGYFVSSQIPTNFLFSDKSMLGHIAMIGTPWMIGAIFIHIPTYHNHPIAVRAP